MLSARSKALRLAFVRSIAHKTFLIVVTSTPHHRRGQSFVPLGCVPQAQSRHQESTVEYHWLETNPHGLDRSRFPLRRRPSAVGQAGSASFVHEARGTVSRYLLPHSRHSSIASQQSASKIEIIGNASASGGDDQRCTLKSEAHRCGFVERSHRLGRLADGIRGANRVSAGAASRGPEYAFTSPNRRCSSQSVHACVISSGVRATKLHQIRSRLGGLERARRHANAQSYAGMSTARPVICPALSFA